MSVCSSMQEDPIAYFDFPPNPVLMKNYAHINKYQLIEQEVELIEANPHRAHVKLPDGHERIGSLQHLASRCDSAIHGHDVGT